MKTTVEIELKPFTVPNFVLAEQKYYPGEEVASPYPRYLLSEISPEILLRMCDQFKDEVFKKAGKIYPPICSSCGR